MLFRSVLMGMGTKYGPVVSSSTNELCSGGSLPLKNVSLSPSYLPLSSSLSMSEGSGVDFAGCVSVVDGQMDRRMLIFSQPKRKRERER